MPHSEIPDDMRSRVSGSIAELIATRTDAAMKILMEKGYESPKISVSFEAMGRYGNTVWARIYLGSSKDWMRHRNYGATPDSIEGLLDEIDASVAEIPAHESIVSDRDAALAKLSVREKELLGINEYSFKR